MAEYDVGEIKECGSAIVHGVVTNLSPMKKSRRDEKMKYFDGQLSNEKSCVWVISMSASLEKNEPVSLVACQDRGGLGGASEIILSKAAKLMQSLRKFSKDSLMKVKKENPPPTKVNDIHSIPTNQQVTVTIKVKTVMLYKLERSRSQDLSVLYLCPW